MSVSVSRAASPEELKHRLETTNAMVGIIGLGYVGLPLAIAANKKGYSVLGFDVKTEMVARLNKGEMPLKHLAQDSVQVARATGRFEATSDFGRLAEADAIMICVPTPLSKHREPDLSFVEATAQTIRDNLQPMQLVILESTSYPGTTEEVVKPILEESGLTAGVDFFLAFSPEREDPGNIDFETTTIPRVVGGDDPVSADLAAVFYGHITNNVVPVSNMRTAEAVKLTENIFRSVNIALVNELKLIYGEMGINIWEVIDAAKTKPFGFMPFYPGPGLGGHCIPIDPFYLTWKAREHDVPTRFIELAGEINTHMPQHTVARVAKALGDRQQKSLNGAHILLLGIAYKKNIDDMRESPSLVLIELLEAAGAQVEYFDPFISEIPITREHAALAGRQCIEWRADTFGRFDAALIATDHDEVDYAELTASVPLIIDTRNATKGIAEGRDRIVLA